MYNMDPDQYVDNQRRDWNGVASGWEKWDEWLDANMADLNLLLVEKAGVKQGHATLDLGSGTGYPAIEAAKLVGESGSVTGLDLSPEMLDAARRKAESLGLGHITFQTCDVRKLPFDEAAFDSVTSRFCLMFVPTPEKTLNEVHRVLKNGRHFAAVVWAGPESNPSLALPMGVMREYIDIPAPDPSAPGLFSLGKPGDLASRMERAGFQNVDEKEIAVQWEYTSGLEYVACMKEIAAPIRDMLEKVPQEKREEVENKIAEKVEEFRDGDKVFFPGVALMVTGRKGQA